MEIQRVEGGAHILASVCQVTELLLGTEAEKGSEPGC